MSIVEQIQIQEAANRKAERDKDVEVPKLTEKDDIHIKPHLKGLWGLMK